MVTILWPQKGALLALEPGGGDEVNQELMEKEEETGE